MSFARRAAYFTPAREHLEKSTGTRILRSLKPAVPAAPFQVIDLNLAPRGNQDRARRVANNAFRCASENNMFQPAEAACWQND